jgi:hypothetical protein
MAAGVTVGGGRYGPDNEKLPAVVSATTGSGIDHEGAQSMNTTITRETVR